MKLELFVLRSATPSFIEILENTVEVLFKHHDETILEECIHTLIDIASRAPEELRVLPILSIEMHAVSECLCLLVVCLESGKGLCQSDRPPNRTGHGRDPASFRFAYVIRRRPQYLNRLLRHA